MHSLYFIYFVIFTALVFDFLNGCHDAANSIATVVSTGALKPFTAVLWAAFFNFIAFLFFHLNVAATFGNGLVAQNCINAYIIFSALSGAILFNLITWYFGLPSSSSHALIGGLIGAVAASSGWHNLYVSGLIKIFAAILISPPLGFGISFLLLLLFKRLQASGSVRFTKSLQLASSALLSLGHGGNDAQKTMGIIALLLYASHLIGPNFYVPFWVIISCNLVMALGTLAGGWRIVKTLGEKITSINAKGGAAAESASALVLFAANYLGIPVSTTHIVTGSIAGIGLRKGWSQVNWKILKRITYAWMLTLPCAALFASLFIWVKML
jgi:PiT family inorganic phosphate transporter